MDTAATKRAAIDAIARYARDVARLPPFPSDPSRQALQPYGFDQSTTVLKAIATDKVPGEMLPRARDAWLAMLPFDDLAKNASHRELIQTRRAFIEILATVARAGDSPFRLDATSSMHRSDDSQHTGSAENTFWSDLMRELDPESDRDRAQEMARCLIAMSHAESLRFLLSVTQATVPANFPEMLEQMLDPRPDATSTESISAVLAACGVSSAVTGRCTVDIALSFSEANISASLLTKVLDVIDRCAQRWAGARSGVELRVTSLRFGRTRVLQAKAIETLGQRKSLSPITDLWLGDLHDVKPASLRLGINGLLSQPSGIRRLAATSPSVFRAVASALRNGASCVQALDVVYEPSIETAAWLAVALFHVDSKSTVSSLRLRVPLSKHLFRFGHTPTGVMNWEWLAAFKRALTSTTAGVDLACLESSEEQENGDGLRRRVTLNVGTPVKIEPYASAKLQCKIVDGTESFEEIATVNNWLAVIVPGLGAGWVPSASVSSEQLVPSGLVADFDGSQINNKVTSLVWDFAVPRVDGHHFYDHTRVLLALLEVVGRPLKSLHLPNLKLTTDDLARVLSHCPNLEELNISGHRMDSIVPLVEAYGNGTCMISTLNIAHPGILIDQVSIPRDVAEILHGPGGHRLRRLAVRVILSQWAHSSITATHEEDMQSMLRALSANTTLELMELPESTLSAFTPTSEDQDRDVPPTSTARAFCTSEMPLSAKLAFLSCLQHQSESSALRRFDACVLALIFRFSGRRIARQILTGSPGGERGFRPNAFLAGSLL